jgi:hypothetical protein
MEIGKHKKKGKIFLVLNQAPHHDDIRGSGGIAPCILNLSATWI